MGGISIYSNNGHDYLQNEISCIIHQKKKVKNILLFLTIIHVIWFNSKIGITEYLELLYRYFYKAGSGFEPSWIEN